jgi:S-(hydroxymethyl)glutathione dehydrogenase/alcohol dehydrogenase
VLVEIKSTGVCHTDEYTRSGADPRACSRRCLGTRGRGVVVEVGEGVTSVAEGIT